MANLIDESVQVMTFAIACHLKLSISLIQTTIKAHLCLHKMILERQSKVLFLLIIFDITSFDEGYDSADDDDGLNPCLKIIAA